MKNAKKVLSILLVLIMTINALTVFAPAEAMSVVNAQEDVAESPQFSSEYGLNSTNKDANEAKLPTIPQDDIYSKHEAYNYESFKYIVDSSGIVIIGFDQSISDVVEIPAEINGIPVIAIGDYAFSGCREITKVILPDSVNIIGNGAFLGCEKLDTVNFNISNITLGRNAFLGCADRIIISQSDDGRVVSVGSGNTNIGITYAGTAAYTAGDDWYVHFSSDLLETLVDGISKREESINISSYNINEAQMDDLYQALVIEYPIETAAAELLAFGYSCYDSKVEEVHPFSMADVTASEYTTRYNKLAAKVDLIMEYMEGKNTYEKILFAHDYLLKNADYDWDFQRYGAYDIIVDGIGVCQGYTLAYQLLMSMCDIPCLMVVSEDMNHSWNIVRLDGEWYHIDLTWDDGIPGYFDFDYIYFLLNDEMLSSDHYNWDANYACTSTKFVNAPRNRNHSQMYYDDRWYMNETYEAIISTNIYGTDKKTICTDNSGGFDIYNNYLFCGSDKSIKAIDLESGKKFTVYTLTDKELEKTELIDPSHIASIEINDNGILSYDYTIWVATSEGDYESKTLDGAVTINLVSEAGYSLPTPVLEAHSVGYTSAKLTWSISAFADGYSIYRCDVAGGEYKYIASVGANVNTYTNTGLSTGTTYYYKVRAYQNLDNGGKSFSPYSNYHSARPIPATPVVTATRTSATTATVSWAKIYGATGYSVYRSTSADGPFTFVAGMADGSETTYKATGLASSKTYYYQVRAYRAMGSDKMFGNYSKIATAPGIPATPAITARSVGYTSAKVVWNAVPNADGYSIYRCDVGGGTYTYIASVGADVTSYTNTGLSTGTTYYYKVRAYVNAGSNKLFSSYSLCATARPIPATPVVTVTTDSANNATISWVRIYGATGYSVYRSTEKDGTYTFLAGISNGDTVSYFDMSTALDATYYYKVRAYRAMGSDKMFSNYSLPVCAKQD